jgi:hypothetical protein
MAATTETAKLRFALEHLDSEHWAQFERFCNAFLGSEFPNLRPIAGTGDRGRDAVLFGTHATGVVIQYSLTKDWRRKIRETIARLRDAAIDCHLLVYATNHHIGPGIDNLRPESIRQGVSLDVRDLDYFVSRMYRDETTRAVAAELADLILDPLLSAADVVEHSAASQPELRAADLARTHDQVHDSILDQLAESAAELEIQTAEWQSPEVVDAIEHFFEEILNRRGNEFVEAVTERRASLPRVDLFDLSRTAITQAVDRLCGASASACDLARMRRMSTSSSGMMSRCTLESSLGGPLPREGEYLASLIGGSPLMHPPSRCRR